MDAGIDKKCICVKKSREPRSLLRTRASGTSWGGLTKSAGKIGKSTNGDIGTIAFENENEIN